MQKQIIAISIVGTLFLAIIGGAVVWVMASSGKQPAKVANVLMAAPRDTSPSSLSATTSDGTSMSGLGASNDQGIALGNQSNTLGASTSAGANSSTNNASATLDPKNFAQYDKYKSEQNALIADIQAGTGAEIAAGQKVSVNYRGWLTNGQMFDENLSTSKPFTLTLGSGQVITGWEQGLAGMKIGGERLIIVPPAAGYGPNGQGSIPGNAVLVFYVKVLAAQ